MTSQTSYTNDLTDPTPPDSGEFFGMVVSGAPLAWQYKQPVELYAD